MTQSFAPNVMPEFRIKLFGTRDGMKVYLVDGFKIRNTIDLDFTDGASHLESKPVPDNEIWIDQDAQGDREYKLTLADVIGTRSGLMSGLPLDKAWKLGAKIEGALRQKQFPSQWLKGGKIDVKQLGFAQGTPVYLVDGMATRNRYDVDFVEGGNSEVYPWMKNALGDPSVAIDNSVFPHERPYIGLHELFESRGMRQEGTQYNQAHRQANRVELAARHDPQFLATALKRLGWEGDPRALGQ